MNTISNSPLTVSDVPAIENDIIQDPATIVADFRSATTSFDCHRVLNEIFMLFVQQQGFRHWPQEKVSYYSHCMQIVSETIFKLERDAQDFDAGNLILKYMETTYNQSRKEVLRVSAHLREIEEKYGSLRKGLDSLHEHKDAKEIAEAHQPLHNQPDTLTPG